MSDQWQQASAIFQLTADRWLSFNSPVFVLAAATPEDVRPVVADVERRTRDKHLHAVGFLTYEAGAAFGLSVRSSEHQLPLAWFGLFAAAHEMTWADLHSVRGDYEIGAVSASVSRDAYRSGF